MGGGGGGGNNTALALHTQTWLTSGQTMNQLVCANVSDAAPLTSLSTSVMYRLISDTCMCFLGLILHTLTNRCCTYHVEAFLQFPLLLNVLYYKIQMCYSHHYVSDPSLLYIYI